MGNLCSEGNETLETSISVSEVRGSGPSTLGMVDAPRSRASVTSGKDHAVIDVHDGSSTGLVTAKRVLKFFVIFSSLKSDPSNRSTMLVRAY